MLTVWALGVEGNDPATSDRRRHKYWMKVRAQEVNRWRGVKRVV